MTMPHNTFNTLQKFKHGQLYSLPALGRALNLPIERLPVSIRIVLEAVLRNCDGKKVTEHHVRELAHWKAVAPRTDEIPFVVARIVLQDFTGVPLGIGIVHQVNLEYLAPGVHKSPEGICYPDTLVGTDSHTTMINGIGVVGWGVGGIEAEAGMLGQPVYFLTPDVVGVHLKGKLHPALTATDVVLTVTEMLRKAKVVGKFVEFYGEGTASLSVTDRATLANMAPDYGATMGFFPVDEKTRSEERRVGKGG